jgi:leucyl-tRNA synthetase
MKPYKAQSIEKKWQDIWETNGHPKPVATKGKYFVLDMFPYPSGDGLHVGHVENYTATDILSRYKRMQGFDVMHPIGWDAFGLPAENFAIKTGIHPDQKTHENIANFTRQIKSLGMSYDWDREIDTSSPEYYKWTQWMFLFLYKNGLAYKKKAHVNWCPSCQTVLANEQVIDGKCDRCKSEVVQKELEQWFFKITDFVEDTVSASGKKISGLLSGLDTVDWPHSTQAAQRNWIGRSVGATVRFMIDDLGFKNESKIANADHIEVFTTRVDTIFGCTYVVLSPEHELLKNQKSKIKNLLEVERYQEVTKKKTDLERTELNKDKTGVKLVGVEAINPFTGESVPVFVADYVLGNYGTGAVMAVPAHDERDFEFAKKYDLPIKQSIASNGEGFDQTVKALRIFEKISSASRERGLKVWVLGGLACAFYARVIYREHSDLDLIVKDNERFEEMGMLLETLGFKKKSEKQLTVNLTNFIFEDENGFQIDLGPNKGEFGLTDEDFEENEKELNGVRALVLGKRFILSFKEFQLKNRSEGKDKIDIEYLHGKVFTEDGIIVDSGEYTGLKSAEAREKMTTWLEEKKLGAKKVNYRLRDWLISRQRYWGAPIPIIYCDPPAGGCGAVPVPEKDLPVKLPTDVDFRPTGESPLLRSESFQKVNCPTCGKKARREADTMDTFVCSSWYYLRFADPKNMQRFADAEKLEKLLPVDFYMGGAEHTVLHLLYARFFTKALAKYEYLTFDEPFAKLRHQGMVLAEDGRKMSKSLGNVVNPDVVVGEFGADTLRLYEMFMGPIEDMKSWNTGSVVGLRRFLEKVWKLQEKVTGNSESVTGKEVASLLHKTIKKVTEDIEELKYNTAISSLMILVNALEKESQLPVASYQLLLQLIAPFAPHIAEEIWENMGNKESIFLEKWPQYDEEKMMEDTVTVVVQVNGKVRANLLLPSGSMEEVVKEAAMADANVQTHIAGKEIRKVIFVQDKILNVVV